MRVKAENEEIGLCVLGRNRSCIFFSTIKPRIGFIFSLRFGKDLICQAENLEIIFSSFRCVKRFVLSLS